MDDNSVKEDDPTNQPQPDFTVHFSTADLIAEQRKDPQLKPMWDAAANPLQTDFVTKNNILYAIHIEPKMKEDPHKIVVPTSLRNRVFIVGHAYSGHFGAKKTHNHIQQHFFLAWHRQSLA